VTSSDDPALARAEGGDGDAAGPASSTDEGWD